jgi:hypothetical protein
VLLQRIGNDSILKVVEVLMLRRFGIPALLVGLTLAFAPASALAQRGGGHGGGGFHGGGGGFHGGGFGGGGFRGGGFGGGGFRGGFGGFRGGGFRGGFGGNRFFGGRGFVGPGFGFWGAPWGFYGGPYYAPYYNYCNPAGYYDQWGNFIYYPGCY